MFKMNQTTNYILSFNLMLLGILFFVSDYIPWVILYALTLLACILIPVSYYYNHKHGYKPDDMIDHIVLYFQFAFAIALLVYPKLYLNYIHFFFGLWMIGTSILSLFQYFALRRDNQPKTMRKLLYVINTFLFGIFMLFSELFNYKTIIITIIIGLFFFIYGLHILFDTLRITHPNSAIVKKLNWTIAPPLLFSAFLPVSVYTSVKALKNIPVEEDDCDLHVYIYVKGTGFEMFGHMDIGYKGYIYSYGCHDPSHRKYGGIIGDGVLIKADEKAFIQNAIQSDDEMVISFGIRLKDSEREILERRINEMMDLCIPWLDPSTTTSDFYAWRIYQATHAQFYKFKGGKFHTYFVASTNCVLLADSLIRNKELSLVAMNGIVVPGAYLTFMNHAYQQENSNVVSRNVYYTDNHESIL